ncbi:MAG: LapA family protein [Solirubrobacterales bacterium]
MANRRDPNSKRDNRSQIRLYLAGAAALAALILIIQNSQKVEFNFFFASAETPLFFGLLIAFVLGAIVGWLLPRVRGTRHRIESKND